MAALDEICSLLVDPTPCKGPQERRNWEAVYRLKGLLCDIFGGEDGIFNSLLIRFRLTETLAPGGSAAAVRLDWDDDTSAWITGAAITVSDDQSSDPWQGLAGYEGWARRKSQEESTAHSIVWMERIAYHIWGTLTDADNGTVDKFSDGKDPGTSVPVFDVNDAFPEREADCTFEAVYDFVAQRYELVVCQQKSWIATCSATQDFGPSTATVSIGSVIFKSYSRHDKEPTPPTQADNTFRLSGDSGDLLHIQKSKASGNWEILTGDSIGSGSSIPLQRFKLTAHLQVGGNAAAVLRNFANGAYADGDAIRVFDWYSQTPQGPGFDRGMWLGYIGQEGWARKREEKLDAEGPDEYEIVWQEQWGRFLDVTLNEQIGESTGGQATATVDFAYGQGDDPGLTLPGNLVNVYDTAGMFPLGFEQGHSVLDEYNSTPDDPVYELFSVKQQCTYGSATLSGSMCPNDGLPTIDNFVARSLLPQGLTPDPLPTKAVNLYKLAGRNGARVHLVYYVGTDAAEEARVNPGLPGEGYWVVIQVEHVLDSLVTEVTFNPDTKCITEAHYEEAAIMTCKQLDGGNVLCFKPCP